LVRCKTQTLLKAHVVSRSKKLIIAHDEGLITFFTGSFKEAFCAYILFFVFC